MCKGAQTNGYIGDSSRWLIPGAIDDGHRHLGNQQHGLEDGQEEEPLPHPIQSLPPGQGGDDDDDDSHDRHGAQQTEVIAATHDGSDGIEHRFQLRDVPIGIDLVHSGSARSTG